MKKILSFILLFFVIFGVSCAAQEEIELKFDPDYSVFAINLDEQQTLKLIVKNNYDVEDTFSLRLDGRAFDIADIKFQETPGLICSSDVECEIEIAPNSEKTVFLQIFGKKVDREELSITVTSQLFGLEVRTTAAMVVQSETGRGIFNAPGLSWTFLALIGLLGALVYFKMR